MNIQVALPLEEQFYWNACACNEYHAVKYRHALGHIAGFDPANPYLQKLESNLMWQAGKMQPFTSVDHKTLMQNTRPPLKKRYRDAYNTLRSRVVNISTKQETAKAFIKYEKVPISKYLSMKPPRLIQFREFTYTYSLKRQLLGHTLQVKDNNELRWHYDQPAKSVITKTMDSYGIAAAMRESWESFADPVAYCLDHSKFDGHYAKELLLIEHKYWKTLNRTRLLSRLLDAQLVNRVRSANGLYWKVTGTRLSGEWTTSEGNTETNYNMIVTWLKESKIIKARVHVNGDDSVVMLERSEANKLLPLGFFRNFNMETELERVTDEFCKIIYCQASPIRVLNNNQVVWYMVKEPIRTLSRLQYCDVRFMPIVDRFLAGVGLCESAVNSGIPITQSIANLLALRSSRPLGSVDKGPALSSGNLIQHKMIQPYTRTDYERAFDISIQHQLEIESYCAGRIRSPTDLSKQLSKFSKFHQK